MSRRRKILLTTLSLLLLIGAGIFIRSLANLHSLDPGFRTENIVEFRVNPRSIGYDAERTRAVSVVEILVPSIGQQALPFLVGGRVEASKMCLPVR